MGWGGMEWVSLHFINNSPGFHTHSLYEVVVK